MITRKLIGYGFLAVLTTLAFIACESPTNEPAHVHQWSAWDVTAPATCIATGSQTRTCALDATHTETEAIPIDLVDGHDWGEWEGTVTCTTAGTGTRVCSRKAEHTETDNDLQPLGHAYNDEDWEETEAPTCSKKGKEEANCVRYAACGNTGTREIAIDPDAHDYQLSSGIAPTCTEDGNGVEICSYNQEHILSGVLPKLGHDDGEWHTALEPDCTTVGSRQLRCTRDNAVLNTETIVALGHDYHWTEITAPSFIEEGEDKEICTHDSLHTRGTRIVPRIPFTSVGALRTYLNTLPSNTAATSYKVSLNVSELSGNDFNSMYGKYIDIDLSGSTELSTIPSSTFSNFNSLTGITLPFGVISIEYAAFDGCANLTSITIPASVTTIAGSAFSHTSLTSIIIPASVTSIHYQAFMDCYNLVAIEVDSGNSTYSSIDGILCNKDQNVLIICPAGKESVIIPVSIISISNNAFSNCTLTSVTIPTSVTSIGNSAFESCAKLTSVTIPASVVSIGDWAFNCCYALMNVIIENGVGSIKLGAFNYCTSLTSVTIPASINSIERGAFNHCIALTSVTFGGTIASDNFVDVAGDYVTFPGDLRDKFYATDSANGTPGTYTTSNPGDSAVWTKQ